MELHEALEIMRGSSEIHFKNNGSPGITYRMKSGVLEKTSDINRGVWSTTVLGLQEAIERSWTQVKKPKILYKCKVRSQISGCNVWLETAWFESQADLLKAYNHRPSTDFMDWETKEFEEIPEQ